MKLVINKRLDYNEEYLKSLPKKRWKIIRKGDNVILYQCKIKTIHGLKYGYKISTPFGFMCTYNSLDAEILFEDFLEDLK